MAGDPLRNVNPGAPWYPSASRENALSAAARKVRDGRDLTDRLSGTNPVDATIILVKNGSGADRGRGEVLGIDGVVFPSASAGADAFLARVLVTGVTPAVGTHDGKFVVLLEPIASGKIGRAVISGAVAVKVSGSGPRADITNASAASLTAGAVGAAQVLWKEGSGSPPWAIVKIGNGPEPIARVGRIVCKGPEGEDTPTDNYRWVQLLNATASCDSEGRWSVTDAAQKLDPCDDTVKPQIVLAPFVNGPTDPYQPNKLVVLVPVPVTGNSNPIRYAIIWIDPRNNNQKCRDEKVCVTRFTYKWGCPSGNSEGVAEEIEGVTEQSRTCTENEPEVAGQWLLSDESSDHTRVFEYFHVGDECEENDDCGTPTPPDPPSADQLAAACGGDTSCENPVKRAWFDDTFAYFEYCDGTVEKWARCCDADPIEGEDYCADLFECEWDCEENAPVVGSMRYISSECGEMDSKSEAWTFHSKSGIVAKLRRWVNTRRICTDGACSPPPITAYPGDYPTSGEVVTAGGCCAGGFDEFVTGNMNSTRALIGNAPAGPLTIAYVEGSMDYNGPDAALKQTVNFDASFYFRVEDEAGNELAVCPGHTSTSGFDTTAEVETASAGMTATFVNPSAGNIYVKLIDEPYDDNVAGDRSPKWRVYC